jgi:gliding motility-associated-like protein
MLKNRKSVRSLFVYLLLSCLFMSGTGLYAHEDETNSPENSPKELDELQLTINLIYQNYVCYNANGDIRLFVMQGTPPYDFQWSNGATTQDLMDVPPGTYQVTVTDATGQEVVETAVFEALPYPGSQIIVDAQDVSCYGTNTGSIATSFQNDTGPYSYVWSNGMSTSAISNLPIGTYTFTVTDAYDCEFDTIIFLTQPTQIVANVYTEPATCNGYMDGQAYVEVDGGVPITGSPTGDEYLYQWPNGENNDTITYYGGTYMMQVVDANNCVVQVPFTIPQPDPVVALPAGNTEICLGGEAVLDTEVTGGISPYYYYWVEQPSMDTVSYSTEMSVSPEETTDYVFHAVDMNGCHSNHVNSTVTVYPELQVTNISLSRDSICNGESVKVELDIEGGNGGPYEILVVNNNQIVPSPFMVSPQQTTTYTVRVSDPCSTPPVFVNFEIIVMPDPEVDFTVDKRHSCPPGVFYFNESSPDVGQSYMWNFGDTQYSIDKNPVHTYTESGDYDVSLTVTSEFGCTVNRTITEMITIYDKPDAEFYVSSNHASILNPIIQFFNVSAYSDSIYWFFGDGDSTLYSNTNPWHEFDNIGVYNVRMLAENSFGCSDTTYKKIRIYDEYTFNAPTAFTPNGDGVNDCFRLCGHGVDVYEFRLLIYDRFGSIVYDTRDFENDLDCSSCGKGSWDGTYNGSYVKGDKLCKSGKYAWYCTYIDAAGVENYEQGTVTLIR